MSTAWREERRQDEGTERDLEKSKGKDVKLGDECD